MKATRALRNEQELIDRFLAVFGMGVVYAGQNKPIQPGFFVYASKFIKGYIEDGYFKKEEVLLKALEEKGIAADAGPLGQMFKDIQESRNLSAEISAAARQWQAGNTDGRTGIIWAASSYSSILRQHVDRSRTTIFPLAEQLISYEDQHQLAESFNRIAFVDDEKQPVEEFSRIIDMLKEEIDEWK